MDLVVCNFGGRPVYIDVTVVMPVVNDPGHLLRAAQKPGYAANRAEYAK